MSLHPRHVAKHIARHAKDHFIPHEGNRHHPHVLKHRVLFGYSVILILLKALTIAGSIALPSWNIQASAITPQNILALTNATRQGIGLEAVVMNDRLASAARSKAEDMAVNGYFAHTSPAGVSPWAWIKNTGYQYRYSAENLAVHFSQSEDVQSGWMASPSHRANIVDARFTETGVGIALGDYEGVPTTFVVQYFAQPKSTAIATAPPVTPPPTQTPTPSPAPTEPVQTQPSPTPAPSTTPASIPEPEPEPEIPPKTEPVVTVTPNNDQYDIKLTSSEAIQATAHLGGQTTELAPDVATNTWSGTIIAPAGSIAPGGEPLYLTVQQADGTTDFAPIATIAPGSGTEEVFGRPTSQRPEVKLFGFLRLEGLNDSAHRIYMYFILFLAASILINILVKFHIQKTSVIAHATFVLGLGILFYFL